jgi:hypothetical protein
MAALTAVSELSATVSLPGLATSLRVLHISDSHVDLGLEHGPLSPHDFVELERQVRAGEASAADAVQVGGYPMVKAYEGGMEQRGGRSKELAAVVFQAQVAQGVAAGAELIALTGDNVNFPSWHAVAFMVGVLESSGLPWVRVLDTNATVVQHLAS